MRIVHKSIAKDGEGRVKLIATEAEDLWHLYNLIDVGNFVKATTIRKVQRETDTGSSESERLKIVLTIEVAEVDFDSQGLQLRIKGRNVVENSHVKVGAFHTIEVELHRSFELTKSKWDVIDLDRLTTASEPTAGADVAAVVMQEGLANVCVLSNSLSRFVARVESNIPRKAAGAAFNKDKSKSKFFDLVYRAIKDKLKLDELKVVILASPGYVKDEFFKYMNAEAVRTDEKSMIKIKPKCILAHSSSGHKHALHEVLANPALQSRLVDTKAAAEVKALETFFDVLNNQPDRACYGPPHVLYAADLGAIQTLLISDSLFRNADVPTRQKYVGVVDVTRSTGGDVHIFSAMHITGEQLNEMTGIAAVLRFPLPELEDMDLEQSP
ncbi:hypothetical protein NDN08_001392 [Rhodosorus marinus]|uniref:Protein pelota homolog n=1 Tax=Rhodosorus marinus TaxID=101924 RepID=A0AAV8UQU5_9RHOD|nr:hypothetical protein NDN08_001392 [Rhodosorus marinus]